jgi:hypothetical protein
MFVRALLTLALVFSVTPPPASGRADILGVVTQASDANLGTGPVSVGASIYDGDRLSTDADGAVTLRGGGAMLYLARQSRMILHSLEAGHSNGTQANLSAGTLVFTASHLSSLEVLADSAHIRAAVDTTTVGQVTVIGPKTLYIYARQGALLFSYEDETEVIPEGKAYRVMLDPPDDDSTNPSNKPADPAPAHGTNRRHRGFLLVLLGVGAAVGGIIRKFDNVESPDHP